MIRERVIAGLERARHEIPEQRRQRGKKAAGRPRKRRDGRGWHCQGSRYPRRSGVRNRQGEGGEDHGRWRLDRDASEPGDGGRPVIDWNKGDAAAQVVALVDVVGAARYKK